MQSESMVVALGRSLTDAGTQRHRLARLERVGENGAVVAPPG